MTSTTTPTTPAAPVRAPWGTLSHELIVQTATALLREGPTTPSVRGVARALGVSPMAIYTHVRSRDELFDESVDRLLAESWTPTVSTANWREWVVDAADRLRSFLVGCPAALEMYLRHPVTSPTAVTRMETVTATLRTAMADTTARQAYAAIHTYTLGFAALEASRGNVDTSAADPLRRELARFTEPARFREGVANLLRGFEAAAPHTEHS